MPRITMTMRDVPVNPCATTIAGAILAFGFFHRRALLSGHVEHPGASALSHPRRHGRHRRGALCGRLHAHALGRPGRAAGFGGRGAGRRRLLPPAGSPRAPCRHAHRRRPDHVVCGAGGDPELSAAVGPSPHRCRARPAGRGARRALAEPVSRAEGRHLRAAADHGLRVERDPARRRHSAAGFHRPHAASSTATCWRSSSPRWQRWRSGRCYPRSGPRPIFSPRASCRTGRARR